MERQTTKYSKLEGGEFNMKLKHILSSLFIGSALFLILPSIASAEDIKFNNYNEELNENLESTHNNHYLQSDEDVVEENDLNVVVERDINSKDTQDSQAETDEFGKNETELPTEEDSEHNVIQSEIDIEGDSHKDSINQELIIETEENENLGKVEDLLETNNSDKSSPTEIELDQSALEEDVKTIELNNKTEQSSTQSLHITNLMLRNSNLSDKEVVQLKKDLTQLGFGRFPNNPSRTYGNVTQKVVKEFQKHFNIPVTGIADLKTLNKINEILNPTYKEGHRGLHIVKLKQDLTSLGFGRFPEKPSIVYGKVTMKVVKEFQKEYGFKQDGLVHQSTLDNLKQILKDSILNGHRSTDVINLKKDLSYLGFGNFPTNPSKNYGKVTSNVVLDFQQHYNLRQSGIADTITLKKIKETMNNAYRNGDSGKHIVSLKKNLTFLGFGNFPTNPSQKYGSVTTNVIKEFQKYYGVKVTGIADYNTFNILNQNVNSPYQIGNTGSHVVKLKKDLSILRIGNFPNNPSKIYGSVTARAVKNFQKNNGLVVNGIGDQITLKLLDELISKADSGIKIFIDPGHGGSDPGATANRLKEKDLTLDISKRVERLLISAGYNVIMTRTDDRYLALEQRSQMANDANADLFMSIHINAGGGRGIETWWNDNNSNPKESKQLASYVQSEIIKSTKAADRGVKGRGPNRGNFHVTREPNMPSALVEVGFIDTKSDADNLKNKNFLQKAAEGIANGIKKFFS